MRKAKAFLAGSSLPRLGLREQVRQVLQKRPDLIPFVSKELSFTEALARGRSDLKISSADLDPAFEVPKSSDNPGNRFQSCQFDPVLGMGHGSDDGSSS